MSQKQSSDTLWTWSAVDLAAAIKSRKISSREAVQSCLSRIDEINPIINAFAEVNHEEALRSADEADSAVTAGKPLGLLHGVPLSTKINIDQRGHATTNGVNLFAENIATEDSPSIALVRESGAVLAARTNVPAFSMRWFSNNNLHGITLNPWSRNHTPGGSSGGAAAAVAAGMMPLAVGNDIGGSIRYPSYCCGVVGIRPTVGRVPGWFGPKHMDQPLCVQQMATDGPIARHVSDLRLALKVMTGYDPQDILSLPLTYQNDRSQRPMHVGLIRKTYTSELSPAVRSALEKAASYLSDAGCVVEEVDIPELEEAYRLWYLLALRELREITPLIELSGDEGALISMNYTCEVASEWWGVDPSLTQFMNGYARRGSLISKLQKFMESYPIILLPVSNEQSFPQDLDIRGVSEMKRAVEANWSMMSIATLGFPAMSVPVGTDNGLPCGVQLLARRYRENELLDAAEIIEARAGILTPITPK